MGNREILDAWQGLDFSIWSYRVSIVGAQLIATADLNQIDVLMRLSAGFAPRGAVDPLYEYEAAQEIQAAAKEEVERSFATYRKVVLISACAAIENLWKATFVRVALRDPSVLSNIEARLSLSASDVISLSDEEKLFALSDELYRACPSGKQRQRALTHFDRHRYLVSSFLPLAEKERAEVLELLDFADSNLFNEVFAVRNCLVHNGGAADRRLGMFGRFELGQTIGLTPALVEEYLAVLEYVATAYIDMIGLGSFDED